MHVACSESELVRASYPTDVLGDIRIRPAEVAINDGTPGSDVEATSSAPRPDPGSACTDISSGNRKARFGVGIVGSIHSQFGPGGESVRHLGNFLTVRSDMERIDDICADQVGTSDRQRVDAI